MEVLVVVLVMAFGLLVSSLIGALLIRAAVTAYNKLSSGDTLKPVAEPSFGKAFAIAILATLVNGTAGFVLGLAVGIWGQSAGMSEQAVKIIAQLLSLPVTVLVMSFVMAGMLPTTFKRGLLITLCYIAIVILLFGGFYLLLVGIGVLTF